MKKQTPFSKTHFQFVYAARRVIDFVFPLYCLSCGKKISTPFSFAFCRTCFRRLVFIRDFSCSLCGRPLPGDPQSSSLCRQCRENRYAFDRCFSSLVFTETLKEAVFAFKYSGKDHYGYFLASLMAARVRKLLSPGKMRDLIVTPVPLSRERMKERGFNQSRVLARHLVRKLGLSPCEDVLLRHVHTPSQTGLDRKERKKNVSGAFSVASGKRVKKRSFLLIDDVMTTGATLSECARVLKREGAGEVTCLTLASVQLV